MLLPESLEVSIWGRVGSSWLLWWPCSRVSPGSPWRSPTCQPGDLYWWMVRAITAVLVPPPPSPSLLQPSPAQVLRSSILGGILQQGSAGAVVTQRFPFPRRDTLLEFENSFLLAEIFSVTVAPEGWSQSLRNASTWTFRMSLAWHRSVGGTRLFLSLAKNKTEMRQSKKKLEVWRG